MEEVRIVDYLERKLKNKSMLASMVGVTEQEKFDNLADDSVRLSVITFNNVTGATAVPFLMAQNTIDQATATMMFGGIQLQSVESNAIACKARFNNKASGWWSILFTYFDQSVGQTIETDIANSGLFYFYTGSARFGTQYGDSEDGLLDFINKTGSYAIGGISLEDYSLADGSTDYTAVKAALTTYFYG